VSFHSRQTRAFYLQCDTCGVETANASMPVEAEQRAIEGGWRSEGNPLRHACPWCVAKKKGAAA
jgi:hypothetical protein